MTIGMTNAAPAGGGGGGEWIEHTATDWSDMFDGSYTALYDLYIEINISQSDIEAVGSLFIPKGKTFTSYSTILSNLRCVGTKRSGTTLITSSSTVGVGTNITGSSIMMMATNYTFSVDFVNETFSITSSFTYPTIPKSNGAKLYYKQ